MHVQIKGNTENATDPGTYYEITNVSGNTLTLDGAAFTAEAEINVTVDEYVDVFAVQISKREDVDVDATGEINIEAGGVVFLGSELDLNIDTVSAGDNVRIKGGQGIYSVAVAGTTNVIAGDLVLEAGGKNPSAPRPHR